jgi:DNA-binding NarL/FixJ family response regulator
MWRYAIGHLADVGLSPLKSLQVLEAADQHEGLEAWESTFSEGMVRLLGATACHLMRVQEGQLRSFRGEAPVRRHRALLSDTAWTQLIEKGTRAFSLSDHGVSVDAVFTAFEGAVDVVYLCGARGVRVALLMAKATPLDERTASVLRNVARHVGASVALRSALERSSLVPEHELPSKLRRALAVLDTRRDAPAAAAKDPLPTLTFLDSLAEKGFAVVQSSRTGRRRRLIAVRPKDAAARAMRTLDTGERAVLAGLKRGLSLKEIAFELDVAEATVSGRIARIRAKIGIDPRSELVRIAEAHARLA